MNSEMFLTSNCVKGGRQTNRQRKIKWEREWGDIEWVSKVPQLEVPNKCQAMKWKLIMQDIL